MIARVIAGILLVSVISIYASPSTRTIKRWNPQSAAADAERDIASSKIRFAYVGGIASHAPGLPSDHRTWLVVLYRYPHLDVGPQGCDQDEHYSEREEYARRYNQRMWSYVSRHR